MEPKYRISRIARRARRMMKPGLPVAALTALVFALGCAAEPVTVIDKCIEAEDLRVREEVQEGAATLVIDVTLEAAVGYFQLTDPGGVVVDTEYPGARTGRTGSIEVDNPSPGSWVAVGRNAKVCIDIKTVYPSPAPVAQLAAGQDGAPRPGGEAVPVAPFKQAPAGEEDDSSNSLAPGVGRVTPPESTPVEAEKPLPAQPSRWSTKNHWFYLFLGAGVLAAAGWARVAYPIVRDFWDGRAQSGDAIDMDFAGGFRNPVTTLELVDGTQELTGELVYLDGGGRLAMDDIDAAVTLERRPSGGWSVASAADGVTINGFGWRDFRGVPIADGDSIWVNEVEVRVTRTEDEFASEQEESIRV